MLRDSLAINLRHCLTGVPLARLRTDVVRRPLFLAVCTPSGLKTFCAKLPSVRARTPFLRWFPKRKSAAGSSLPNQRAGVSTCELINTRDARLETSLGSPPAAGPRRPLPAVYASVWHVSAAPPGRPCGVRLSCGPSAAGSRAAPRRREGWWPLARAASCAARRASAGGRRRVCGSGCARWASWA